MSFNQVSGYVKLNNNLFNIFEKESNREHVKSVEAV